MWIEFFIIFSMCWRPWKSLCINRAEDSGIASTARIKMHATSSSVLEVRYAQFLNKHILKWLHPLFCCMQHMRSSRQHVVKPYSKQRCVDKPFPKRNWEDLLLGWPCWFCAQEETSQRDVNAKRAVVYQSVIAAMITAKFFRNSKTFPVRSSIRTKRLK